MFNLIKECARRIKLGQMSTALCQIIRRFRRAGNVAERVFIMKPMAAVGVARGNVVWEIIF